jgi:hypothetical protein
MMKYADKSVPISIKAELVEDRISMDFANGIPTQAKKVESTRIGLKTCEKICSDLQGNFRYQEEAESFRTHIDFPAIPAEPEISAEAETPTEPEPEPAPASKPDLEPEPDPETVRASAPVTEEQPAAELQSAVYGQLETSGQPGASAQSETRE